VTRLAVVAYPALSDDDRAWIDAIRARYAPGVAQRGACDPRISGFAAQFDEARRRSDNGHYVKSCPRGRRISAWR
jgi:hypothetical protein